MFITSLSAYAYERLDFKGGDKIFWTLMYMSMFPNVVAILPQFRIANALGWVNNLNALIWPMLAGVFNIFMIRNFMKSIPKALDEAATIDGANPVQQFMHITLPYMIFVLTPYIITSFTGNINNFNIIYLLSGGGPTYVGDSAGQTDLLVTWLYKLTIDNQQYNLAAVIGILTFIVLATVALLTYRNSGSYKDEEGFK